MPLQDETRWIYQDTLWWSFCQGICQKRIAAWDPWEPTFCKEKVSCGSFTPPTGLQTRPNQSSRTGRFLTGQVTFQAHPQWAMVQANYPPAKSITKTIKHVVAWASKMLQLLAPERTCWNWNFCLSADMIQLTNRLIF